MSRTSKYGSVHTFLTLKLYAIKMTNVGKRLTYYYGSRIIESSIY